MPAPTNSERIEANTTAIRSVERTVDVHEQRLTTLDRELDRLADGFDLHRDQQSRLDERVKHLERAADRNWRLLLVVLAAVGALIVHLVLNLLNS